MNVSRHSNFLSGSIIGEGQVSARRVPGTEVSSEDLIAGVLIETRPGEASLEHGLAVLRPAQDVGSVSLRCGANKKSKLGCADRVADLVHFDIETRRNVSQRRGWNRDRQENQ